MKLNFGCGENRLKGWANYDTEVDISRKLPFRGSVADFIFIEHCVEHIDYYKAIDFFKECLRVLKPEGVLRVVVPSIEKIRYCANDEYLQLTTKWQSLGPTVRGALHAILYAHGHKTAWTASLLGATLFYCGFDKIVACSLHVSDHPDLCGVEGHHRIIGERNNEIESIAYEATKGE